MFNELPEHAGEAGAKQQRSDEDLYADLAAALERELTDNVPPTVLLRRPHEGAYRWKVSGLTVFRMLAEQATSEATRLLGAERTKVALKRLGRHEEEVLKAALVSSDLMKPHARSNTGIELVRRRPTRGEPGYLWEGVEFVDDDVIFNGNTGEIIRDYRRPPATTEEAKARREADEQEGRAILAANRARRKTSKGKGDGGPKKSGRVVTPALPQPKAGRARTR